MTLAVLVQENRIRLAGPAQSSRDPCGDFFLNSSQAMLASQRSWDNMAHSERVSVATKWAEKNKFNASQQEALISVLKILEVIELDGIFISLPRGQNDILCNDCTGRKMAHC